MSRCASRESCDHLLMRGWTVAVMTWCGLACGPAGQPYNRSQLSCLVGRLDLAAAGGDDELQKFFARSELARDTACPPRAKNGAQAAMAKSRPAPRRPAQPGGNVAERTQR